ncbi:MAG: 3-deoxy-manno-octulosonate cytidylyltransferase [Chitinispirillaceae bacterium]|nr:3-deoxy-manno-octulosonate cytidylyltransferase [Chitinispirillaceae bacterium]
MSNRVICVIPARYGSTRLPGKPLLEIDGLPLVMWAYRSAQRAEVFDRVLVATDDGRIADAVVKHGGVAVMTSAGHVRGSDRVWEAVQACECGYVVNLQGDEPDLPAGMLKMFVAGVRGLDDNTLLTVVSHATITAVQDPNVVKVVLDATGKALYFSRSVIPYDREKGDRPAVFLKHSGIYGFTRTGLSRYASLPEGSLERRESLEQLRALESGMGIRCLVHDFESVGIDTPDDLAAFRKRHERTNGKNGTYGNGEQKNPDRR